MRTSGNSLIRLLLSRDGQGKNIGEKIQEGVRQEIAIQWLAEKRQRSNISVPACRYC